MNSFGFLLSYQNLKHKLSDLVPDKLDTDLPQALSRSIPPEMTYQLTNTVTQSVIPAVLRAMKRTFPQVWEYPACTDTECRKINDQVSMHFLEYVFV